MFEKQEKPKINDFEEKKFGSEAKKIIYPDSPKWNGPERIQTHNTSENGQILLRIKKKSIRKRGGERERVHPVRDPVPLGSVVLAPSGRPVRPTLRVS